MITGRINFLAQRNEPNPLEVTYWVDLGADPNGGVIKCYDGKKWNNITGGDSSVVDDIASLYASVASLQLTKLNKREYESFVEECNDAHNTLNSTKANKSTTLSGYGITDAYTKTQTDSKINELASSKVTVQEQQNTVSLVQMIMETIQLQEYLKYQDIEVQKILGGILGLFVMI